VNRPLPIPEVAGGQPEDTTMAAKKRESDPEKHLQGLIETAKKRMDKLKDKDGEGADKRLAHKRLKRAQRALKQQQVQAAKRAGKKEEKKD
jgi:hypothetical protein